MVGEAASVDIVIPARAGSTRFPNKPLAQLAGRSMLQRVWTLASAVPSAGRVVVTSDDAAILAHARGFGAEVVATDGGCRNGSERVAQAAAKLTHPAAIVVNLQGDAPLVPPHVVEAAIAALRKSVVADITTPCVALHAAAYARYCARKAGGRSSGTTVVRNQANLAMYFSKAVLPKLRAGPLNAVAAYQHVGLYVFRARALQAYAQLPPTPLEQQEQLEQLRWLEHGRQLEVVEVDLRGRSLWSIDHREDLAVAEQILAEEGELV